MVRKAMQEPKKHHHVPVFYLNRWRGGDGKVHVIRNINGRIVRSERAPEYLGFEYDLYSYHEDFDAANRAEIETKFFKRLDNAGAIIVSKIIAGCSLKKRDRILWTQFLTSMKIRTPENVEKIRTEWQSAFVTGMKPAQSDYAKLKQDTDPETAVEWLRANRPGLIESIGVGQLPKIASNTRAMQTVASFCWQIVDFENSSKLLLASDRPCVYTEGLGKPNCVIALPLSPRYAFFAFLPDSDAQRILMEKPISQLAEELNESVVGQAAARAYSQNGDAPDEFFQRHLSHS